MTLARRRIGHGEQDKAYADYELDDVSGKITAVMGANPLDKPFQAEVELRNSSQKFSYVIPPGTSKEVRFNMPKAQQPLEKDVIKRMAEPAP